MERYISGVNNYNLPMMYPDKEGDFVEFEEVNNFLKEILQLFKHIYPCPGTVSAEAVKAVKTILEREIEE